MSKLGRGKYIRTKKHREKMCLVQSGKKLSEETKKKLSELAKKRKPNPAFTFKGHHHKKKISNF